MRLRSSLTIIMAAMLTALLALDGCVTEPATEVTPARKACIELMQKVPVYYEDFEFWDASILQSDADLTEFYKVWHGRRGEWLENFGISSANVDYVAEAGVLTLARGDFSLQDVRDGLSLFEDDYYLDTSYTDMEVWVAKPSEEPTRIGGAVALAEGLFVWGNKFNVDDYLRVVRGEELSMYDKNAAEVLERLPEGIMTRISRSPYPEGVIISGGSIKKEERGTYSWVNVYKFESPEAVESADADEYFKGIEDGFKEAESVFAERGEPCPFRSFTLKQEGEFVKWSVLVEEQYMIALLFYG